MSSKGEKVDKKALKEIKKIKPKEGIKMRPNKDGVDSEGFFQERGVPEV